MTVVMHLMNLAILCFLLATAPAAHAEIVAAQPDKIFIEEVIYACMVEDFRTVFLTDRASWNTEPLPYGFGWRPISFTLHFGQSIEQGDRFLVKWSDGSNTDAPQGAWAVVEARTSMGSGRDNLLFSGALGEGMLSASILTAGIDHPVRMSWSDLSGRLYLDAFMYCHRAGTNTELPPDN